MLSRKQQWRMVCGTANSKNYSSSSRSARSKCGGSYPLRPTTSLLPGGRCRDFFGAAVTATTTTTANSNRDDDHHDELEPLSPQATTVSAKPPSPPPPPARVSPGENCHGDIMVDSGSIDGIDSAEGDRSGRRSVCFDLRVRVILVPTRHELKETDYSAPKSEGSGAGEADDDDDGGDGIWWTMRECFEFRMAYRRQIFALGLTCKTLLCPATVVFMAGAREEEEEEEKEEGKRSDGGDGNACVVSRDVGATAAAAAAATAAAAHVLSPSPASIPHVQPAMAVG